MCQERREVWERHEQVAREERDRLADADLLEILSSYPDADFYVCGPSIFEGAVQAMLQRANVAASRIHVERFAHAGGPAA